MLIILRFLEEFYFILLSISNSSPASRTNNKTREFVINPRVFTL